MKRELARRPSLLLAGCLIAGLVAASAWVWAPLALALAWIAPGLSWRVAAMGSFVLGLLLAPQPAERIREAGPFHADALVLEVPRLSGSRQVCEVESGRLRYFLNVPLEPELGPGDVVRVRGELRPLPSHLWEVASLQSLSGSVRAESVSLLQSGPAPYRTGIGWRSDFVAFARGILDPIPAAAVGALCFNVTADLNRETYENLQRTGTIHIISASGLHVLIFAVGLSAALSLLPIPRGWRLALIAGVLIFYAVGAGMRPPVIRSVAMAAILGAATLLRKEPDLLAALGVTALAYLLWRPVAVYDIGFQLSFVTVGALAMFSRFPKEWPSGSFGRLARGVGSVAHASWIATLASAPLTAYYFGMVSVVSIPANVLIATALPPITLTSFAAHALFGVVPSVGAGLMVGVVQPLVGWVLWVVDTFGSLGVAAFHVPAFSAYWMLPYYGCLLLLWRPHGRPL
jgi:ComEC/Rec2-related protein